MVHCRQGYGFESGVDPRVLIGSGSDLFKRSLIRIPLKEITWAWNCFSLFWLGLLVLYFCFLLFFFVFFSFFLLLYLSSLSFPLYLSFVLSRTISNSLYIFFSLNLSFSHFVSIISPYFFPITLFLSIYLYFSLSSCLLNPDHPSTDISCLCKRHIKKADSLSKLFLFFFYSQNIHYIWMAQCFVKLYQNTKIIHYNILF